VDVVFGTDVMADVKGRTRGEVAIEYIDSFQEAGVSAADILRAMTAEPPRCSASRASVARFVSE
jgi:hypothetical protein